MIVKAVDGEPRARKEEAMDDSMSLQVFYFTILLIQRLIFPMLKVPFQLKWNLASD